MLLDLFAAEKAGQRVSITSACIAASAPTTTALRCLKQLEENEFLYREFDPSDRRRMYVRLSAETIAKMQSLLGELTNSA